MAGARRGHLLTSSGLLHVEADFFTLRIEKSGTQAVLNKFNKRRFSRRKVTFSEKFSSTSLFFEMEPKAELSSAERSP
jgi:hypothetical protein